MIYGWKGGTLAFKTHHSECPYLKTPRRHSPSKLDFKIRKCRKSAKSKIGKVKNRQSQKSQKISKNLKKKLFFFRKKSTFSSWKYFHFWLLEFLELPETTKRPENQQMLIFRKRNQPMSSCRSMGVIRPESDFSTESAQFWPNPSLAESLGEEIHLVDFLDTGWAKKKIQPALDCFRSILTLWDTLGGIFLTTGREVHLIWAMSGTRWRTISFELTFSHKRASRLQVRDFKIWPSHLGFDLSTPCVSHTASFGVNRFCFSLLYTSPSPRD